MKFKRLGKLAQRVLIAITPGLYRLWAMTLRYEEIGRETVDKLNAERKVFVICLWHGEIFTLWSVKRQLRMTAVISQSKDGEFLSTIIERMGFKVVRGSSHRGGAEALRGIVRVMRRDSENPCVTMDGPRGPALEVKDGVIFMAHFGRGLMVPTRVQSKNFIRLNSWDKHLIPLPFSRVRVIFGEPYALESETLDDAALEYERERIKWKMDELDKYAF